MAIATGSSGRTELSDINATPLLNVLLLLLVIFMIEQSSQRRSIDVHLPSDERLHPLTSHFVLEIAADGTMNINTEPVSADRLEVRLREIYTGRDDRVLFVKAADDVVYQQVISALEAARGAGIFVLGVVL